jgi:hypothetical protein
MSVEVLMGGIRSAWPSRSNRPMRCVGSCSSTHVERSRFLKENLRVGNFCKDNPRDRAWRHCQPKHLSPLFTTVSCFNLSSCVPGLVRESVAAFRCCTCRASWSSWLQASQALAPDHMVEAPSSRRGLDVRRINAGEENDSTEHKAMTLLERKVTAQVTGNCSC